ncbi:MAG: type II secretion system protein [Candidatus Eremiobacteraeota bacterium]|nr:type II secretion system protein [Candidatus Eremiobacteraeota bacterium]
MTGHTVKTVQCALHDKDGAIVNEERAFTLIEIVVALAILAASLILIISVIPTGVMSLKKAEDYQSASAYAAYLVEEARQQRPPSASYPLTDWVGEKAINRTVFTFQRDIYAVDRQEPHRVFDIIVTVRWVRTPRPLTLSTRVYFQDK